MTDRGEQQLDSYRLIRLLGSGGFGEVYLGEHVYHKTQVAIKVLPQLDNDDLPNFLNEARTFRLNHPNIVRILDFGVAKESYTPFLVMEYAPNGSLRQRYGKGTQLPLPAIVSYVRQIAGALQYAHGERLIHRDVKPANMLLGSRNEVLLSDFGTALIASSSFFRITQNVAGTAIYMAPEQLQGKPCFASDQYALGIVVYEWLCGEVPFQGSFFDLYNLHLNVPPHSLRVRLPTISPEVEQVVMRALAKDPLHRFVSIQAFADALEQSAWGASNKLYLPPITAFQSTPSFQKTQADFLHGSPPAAEAIPYPRPEPPKRGISRRGFMSLALGLVVVGGGGGGALAWLLKNQPGPTSAQRPTDILIPTPLVTTILTYSKHLNEVFAVAWSPDSKSIASGGGNKSTRHGDTTVQVWQAQTGNLLYTYHGHNVVVRSVAWSPNGRRIASGSEDTTVQVWDAATGSNVVTYSGHHDIVFAIAWSPDGKYICSSSKDGKVQVWDAATGGNSFNYTYDGHFPNDIYAVAWSPDGQRIASGSKDTTVQVWDATTGNNVITYTGHTSYVGSVAWSPDGKYIASGGYDRTVQVWDPTIGKTISSGYSGQIYTVSWSPDSKYIASGGDDKTVQIWEARTGKHIYTYADHTGPIISAPWSPSGKFIASGGFDNVIRVWQPPQE